MVVENKVTPNPRSTWLSVVVVAALGLTVGALGGYFGYSFAVVGRSPLVRLKGGANQAPLEETFRGMARLSGLEMSAGRCDGKPIPSGIIEREKQVIDQIEAGSKKANLAPPLNVARAIVAYREAKMANVRSDEQASGSFVQQETAFLQAAGWKDTSPDQFANTVRDLDGCQSQTAPKERQ